MILKMDYTPLLVALGVWFGGVTHAC